MHSAKRITLLWKRDNEYKQSKKEGARSSGKQRGNSKTNSVRVMLVDGQSSGADNALHARVAVALFAELIVLSVEPMASLFCSFFFWFLIPCRPIVCNHPRDQKIGLPFIVRPIP